MPVIYESLFGKHESVFGMQESLFGKQESLFGKQGSERNRWNQIRIKELSQDSASFRITSTKIDSGGPFVVFRYQL